MLMHYLHAFIMAYGQLVKLEVEAGDIHGRGQDSKF